MKLPVLVSVPHAGLRVPPEVEPYCILTPEELLVDGDEGAADIYALADDVAAFCTTDIARAVVDLNRPEDDRGVDGVVKTRTIWNVPIYNQPLTNELVEQLLDAYYRPYHRGLRQRDYKGIVLCVDCHTMAATGPPIGPDTGAERPAVCLGDVHGRTLPSGWMERLQGEFAAAFSGFTVTVNDPFAGGFITRTHGQDRPWVQLELSRAAFLSDDEKRARVLDALRRFCETV